MQQSTQQLSGNILPHGNGTNNELSSVEGKNQEGSLSGGEGSGV